MWNRCDLAWAAGIMDGEGSFMARPNKRDRPYPLARVGQSVVGDVIPDMLTRLQSIFGGSISNPNKASTFPHAKLQRAWVLAGRERVQAAIAAMWPWLGPDKRAMASRVLRACNGI